MNSTCVTSVFKLSCIKFCKILQDTAVTSWTFFKTKPLVQDVTIFDFGMQLASFQFWNLYLVYTAVRCTVLVLKYMMTNVEDNLSNRSIKKNNVWKQAQLYSSTKVVGILVSQIVLIASGFSSLVWGVCVLIWGGFLAGASACAYLKSE